MRNRLFNLLLSVNTIGFAPWKKPESNRFSQRKTRKNNAVHASRAYCVTFTPLRRRRRRHNVSTIAFNKFGMKDFINQWFNLADFEAIFEFVMSRKNINKK